MKELLQLNGRQEYQKWLEYDGLPNPLRQELEGLRGDEAAIEDHFGHHLQFGTGGLRGILGVGTNRMNIYTVRKTSWALAQFVLRQGAEAGKRGVAVGYDCRHMSKEFAQEVGLTMAAAGVRAYVSPYLCPTPEVSFAVRHLHAAAGVMITASHNPPEYNGYKAYGPWGYQLLPADTTRISDLAQEIADLFTLPTLPLAEAIDCGLFSWMGPEVRESYVENVIKEVSFTSIGVSERRQLKIVYTPLYGAGNIPVRKALQGSGYHRVHVVKEQEAPNGDFPTVKSPNPEEHDALKLGMELAKEVEADLVLGTDPDSDRVGIAVRDLHGAYKLLTGNQVGALLTEFILGRRQAEGRLPADGIVFKTIVTSELGQSIANSYHMAVENTLTGFKYIGERLTHYEQAREHTFLLGYEESYGYLVSPMVRDKDAVQTCLAIAEMCAFYKSSGQNLLDVLSTLFHKFGYYEEELFTIQLDESGDQGRGHAIMDKLRSEIPEVEGLRVIAVENYETLKRTMVTPDGKLDASSTPLHLPQSDVLKYLFEDGSWLAIRPSGTEPKVKAYLAAKGESQADCSTKVKRMRDVIANAAKARL